MPKRGRYFRCTDMSSLRVKIGLEVVVQNVFDTDEVPTISAKTIFIKLFARCRMTKLSSLETIAVLIFCLMLKYKPLFHNRIFFATDVSYSTLI